MKYLFKIMVITALLSPLMTSAQIPHISGTINISVKTGLIAGDVTVSHMPRISGYSLWLNAGFNINFIRDSADRTNYFYARYYNDNQSSEAFQYFLPASDRTKRFLPKTLRIKYVGSFPVRSDTARQYNGGDWKGNMAFNGKYVRLTEQSAWYPMLYDTLKDVLYDKVTYDLAIKMDDGRSIYLNGSPPVSATNQNFKSDIPVSLSLFAGDFDFNKVNKTYFVNTTLKSSQEQILSAWTDKITDFYQSKLKIPYGNAVTYLAAEPVTKRNNWMYVTYPTVTVIGRGPYTLNSYVDNKKKELRDSAAIPYIAHELGHYYFGTYLVPNSDLRWVFLEGFTEYIALQTTRDILPPKYYKQLLNGYLADVKDYKVTPLDAFKNANDVDETYRYKYTPLLLTALEKEVGQAQVWKWLNLVLTSKNSGTNYDFFESSLLQSGVTVQQFNDFEGKYIKSASAKQNVIDKVNQGF